MRFRQNSLEAVRVRAIKTVEYFNKEINLMKSFSYVITDPEGIHARPAGELVKQCKSYASKITIIKDGKSANAAKILAVMSLGVKKGHEVTFQIEGADEDKAAAEIEAFMKANL